MESELTFDAFFGLFNKLFIKATAGGIYQYHGMRCFGCRFDFRKILQKVMLHRVICN